MIKYVPYLLVMALVTYLIRALPLVLFQKEIKNVYIKSFLHYVPYAVLSAMTFPAVFLLSESMLASCIAAGGALILAYRGKSLLTVALCACILLWLAEFILL